MIRRPYDRVTSSRIRTLRAQDSPAQARERRIRAIVGEWALLDAVGLLDSQEPDLEAVAEWERLARSVTDRMQREP